MYEGTRVLFVVVVLKKFKETKEWYLALLSSCAKYLQRYAYQGGR